MTEEGKEDGRIGSGRVNTCSKNRGNFLESGKE